MKNLIITILSVLLLVGCATNSKVSCTYFDQTDVETESESEIWEEGATVQIEGAVTYIVWQNGWSLIATTESEVEYPSMVVYEGEVLMKSPKGHVELYEGILSPTVGCIVVDLWNSESGAEDKTLFIKQ